MYRRVLNNSTYVGIITQEAWQDGELCAVGKTIFCGFDFTVHKSEPISPEFRAVLEKYRFDPTAQEAE